MPNGFTWGKRHDDRRLPAPDHADLPLFHVALERFACRRQLWDKLREQGRVNDVPREDVHCRSGAQRNRALEERETLNLTEEGNNLLNQTRGPLVLRRHRARFFKQQSALNRGFVDAGDRFAPDSIVHQMSAMGTSIRSACAGKMTVLCWYAVAAVGVVWLLVAAGCGNGSRGAVDAGQDVTVSSPDLAVAPELALPADPAAPRFSQVGRYTLIVGATGDQADIYYPSPPDLKTGGHAFPLVLLLQGAKVDKAHYSEVAGAVARHGFVVAVPNHTNLMGLFSEHRVITGTLEQMKREKASASSPVSGVVATSRLGLVGHSYGGVVGLLAVQGVCQMPFCYGAFERPPELAAGAFYGTNMKQPLGPIPEVHNHGIAIALIQGDLDSKAKPVDAQTTYDRIQNPPKALITVAGANHYGICNTNNPTGADPDPVAPTVSQEVAVETVARWVAVFLRAYLSGETPAQEYLHQTGDGLDPLVTVTSRL